MLIQFSLIRLFSVITLMLSFPFAAWGSFDTSISLSFIKPTSSLGKGILDVEVGATASSPIRKLVLKLWENNGGMRTLGEFDAPPYKVQFDTRSVAIDAWHTTRDFMFVAYAYTDFGFSYKQIKLTTANPISEQCMFNYPELSIEGLPATADEGTYSATIKIVNKNTGPCASSTYGIDLLSGAASWTTGNAGPTVELSNAETLVQFGPGELGFIPFSFTLKGKILKNAALSISVPINILGDEEIPRKFMRGLSAGYASASIAPRTMGSKKLRNKH